MAPIVQQLTESLEGGTTPIQDVLVNEESGELSLEAQVLADFLTHVDFAGAWDVEAAVKEAREFELEPEDGGEKTTVQIMPGFAVGAALDEDDLFALLVHYVEHLHEHAETLEDKARVAAFADLLDLEEGPNKKGAMRKKQKGGPKKRNSVVRQMLAMIHKGVLARTGDGYKKGKGYKKGGTPAGKIKVQKYKKKNVGKMKRAAVKAGAESFLTPFDFEQLEEYAEWGLAVPVDGFLYQCNMRDDADARVAEMSERYGMAFMKAKKGKSAPKAGMKGLKAEEEDPDVKEKEAPATEAERGAALAKGIIDLHEGTVHVTQQITESAKKDEESEETDGKK